MNFVKPLILLFFSFLLCNNAVSQENVYLENINDYKQLNLLQFLEKVNRNTNIRCFYNKDSIPDIQISLTNDSLTIYEILEENLEPFNFSITRNKNNYFVYKKEIRTQLGSNFYDVIKKKNRTKQEDEITKGKDKYLKTYEDYINKTIEIGEKNNSNQQGYCKINGMVINSENGDPVPQATIHVLEENKYKAADVLGNYGLRLKRGEYTIKISSIGFHSKKFKVKLYSGGKLNTRLDKKTYMLDEAVVLSSRHNNKRQTEMGFEKISPKSMKKIPVVMGEQDVIKVALLLPGVQSVGELSSGFNVRGSPSDQNIFYIDDLPVYNVSHLFGLFTSFNSDAIDNFSMYKSNIPIEYGGRLSSLFDISVKEGNLENFSARGGISPVSSKVMVEGPMKKGQSSYLVSGRTTYSDWIFNKIKNLDVRNSSASFSDALIKLRFGLDSLNKINFISYASNDKSDLAFGIKNQYGNVGVGISWNHRFNGTIKSELSLLYSNYNFKEETYNIPYKASKHSFGINHTELKLNIFHKYKSVHHLKYGFNSVLYNLNNGDLLPAGDESVIKPVDLKPEQGWKNTIFLGDEWEITSDFVINGGLRATIYSYLGPQKVYSYRPGCPREANYITDTTNYKDFSFIKNYPRLDYRLSGKYSLKSDLSVKASYNKIHQYIYMLSNSISISPTDKWKLSDSHLKPMEGHQFSTGLYKQFNNDIEISLEMYYKKVNNLVDYKDGAEFVFNEKPETDIIQGNLNAYGAELMLKKKKGDLSGWINYSYSRSIVEAVNEKRGEYNNQGMPYPANYDKPHSVNMTLNYDITRQINISTNIVYSTGRPVTYPTSVYYLNNTQITGFSQKNEYRMKDYFRVDLSLNFEGNLKKNKFAHSSWSVSFYNLTSRKNPYSLYFENQEGKLKGYRLSILGTIIPSIRYNLKLGNYDD